MDSNVNNLCWVPNFKFCCLIDSNESLVTDNTLTMTKMDEDIGCVSQLVSCSSKWILTTVYTWSGIKCETDNHFIQLWNNRHTGVLCQFTYLQTSWIFIEFLSGCRMLEMSIILSALLLGRAETKETMTREPKTDIIFSSGLGMLQGFQIKVIWQLLMLPFMCQFRFCNVIIQIFLSCLIWFLLHSIQSSPSGLIFIYGVESWKVSLQVYSNCDH